MQIDDWHLKQGEGPPCEGGGVRVRGLLITTGCPSLRSVFTGLTCSTECAARVVAALGLVRNLPRCTVEMQVGGDPAGLDGYQVTPNSWTREELL